MTELPPGEKPELEILPEPGADDQPEDLAAPPRPREFELLPPSASGLHEEDIAAEDIEQINALLRVKRLVFPESTPALQLLELPRAQAALHDVGLQLAVPKTLKLRIVALPERARVHALKIDHLRARLHHSLELVQRQPLRRRRILPGELSAEQREALLRALYKQYGRAAEKLMPEALYAHVPPELKDSLRLSPDGASLGILVPKGFNAARATPGHYLILLSERGEAGTETRRILLRL